MHMLVSFEKCFAYKVSYGLGSVRSSLKYLQFLLAELDKFKALIH